MCPSLEPVTYPHAIESNLDSVTIQDYGPDRAGKRYYARVWDKRRRAHKNKFHDSIAEARRWARELRADFTKDLNRAGRLTLESQITPYIEHLKAEGDCAEHTSSVEQVLRGAVKAGVSDLKVDGVDALVQRYLNRLKDRRLRKVAEDRDISTSTRLKFTLFFASFGNWCVLKNKLTRNPFVTLACPRLDKVTQPYFTPSEARKLVSDDALAHPVGMLVALSLYSGLRLREALWLRWEHINWTESTLHVALPDHIDLKEASDNKISSKSDDSDEAWKQVKNNKERHPRLEDELAEILRPHAQHSGYIFPSAFRLKQRGKQFFRRSLKSLCRSMGFEVGKRRWHSLRNTNAAFQRAAGVSSDDIKDWLGHESHVMTARYAAGAKMIAVECRGWEGKIRLRHTSSVEPKATPLNAQKISG